MSDDLSQPYEGIAVPTHVSHSTAPDERTAPAPASSRKCYICGSYHAAEAGCPPVLPGEPEQPPITAQELRAVAKRLRRDAVPTLKDCQLLEGLADWMERRQ